MKVFYSVCLSQLVLSLAVLASYQDFKNNHVLPQKERHGKSKPCQKFSYRHFSFDCLNLSKVYTCQLESF